FLAAASHMDDAIGQVVKAIEKSGAMETTIFIFTSDNGGVHWAHKGNAYPAPDPPMSKGFSSNAPLRAGKITAYEGGIRVPAFITWAATLKPHKTTTRMHVVDWMPTLANLLGVKMPEGAAWDGQDVWPLLTGEQQAYQNPRTIYTIWNNRRWEALHHGEWKIVRQKGKAWELYNLAEDPSEKNNLAQIEFETAGMLAGLYEREKMKDK
ncbi:MAG: sulfatase-like hydrolase/transferase, partial [Pseudomonadota bacterium]